MNFLASTVTASPVSRRRFLAGLAASSLVLATRVNGAHAVARMLQADGDLAFEPDLFVAIAPDGVVTIIRVAPLIAKNREFSDATVIGTVLGIQFVAIPFAFLFGQMAKRFGARALIFSGLVPNLVSRPLHFALALPWLFFFDQGGSLARRLFFINLLLCAAGFHRGSRSVPIAFTGTGFQRSIGRP